MPRVVFHSDPDEAFGLGMYGFYYVGHMMLTIGVNWRVMPMTGVVTVLGLAVGELCRKLIDRDGLSNAMPLMLGISVYFLQFCISQAVIYAQQAHVTACERLFLVVSAANTLRDTVLAQKTQKACIGIIYGNSRAKVDAYKITEGAEAEHALMIAAKLESPDRDAVVKILDLLGLMHASSINGTLVWCNAAMMDIILLTLVVPLPISLLVLMGRTYVVVLSFSVIVILGGYEMALAGMFTFLLFSS